MSYCLFLSFVVFPAHHDALNQHLHHLRSLAFQESTKKTLRSYLRSYLLFCDHFSFRPFPVTKAIYLSYLAFLSRSLKSYSSVLNYLSIIRHINQSVGISYNFLHDYDVAITKQAVRRFLGDYTARKLPITIDLLLRMLQLFDPHNALHVCMRALFLVAFFSFLRISNLVPRTLSDIGSPQASHLTRSCVRFFPQGACLRITRTKTIQFNQRVLEIPLPLISGSPLCPVTAIRQYIASTPLQPHMPLFIIHKHHTHSPVLAHHYNAFIKAAISAIGADPTKYSSHSFRRGGASFAFNNQAPTEFIKAQGDWKSDAYLIYLTLSARKKFKILKSITARLSPS